MIGMQSNKNSFWITVVQQSLFVGIWLNTPYSILTFFFSVIHGGLVTKHRSEGIQKLNNQKRKNETHLTNNLRNRKNRKAEVDRVKESKRGSDLHKPIDKVDHARIVAMARSLSAKEIIQKAKQKHGQTQKKQLNKPKLNTSRKHQTWSQILSMKYVFLGNFLGIALNI